MNCQIVRTARLYLWKLRTSKAAGKKLAADGFSTQQLSLALCTVQGVVYHTIREAIAERRLRRIA